MNTANAHLNPKKSPIQLSVQREQLQHATQAYWREENEKKALKNLGGRAFLSAIDYQKVLGLWVEKGERIESEKNEPSRRLCRESILKKLSTAKTHSTIINAGIPRGTEEERLDLKYLLDEAGGDPLMMLNLCGIPPLLVLARLEYLTVNHKAYNDASEKLAHEANRISDALDYLARAFDTLEPFMQDCLDQINRRKRIQEQNRLVNKTLQKYMRFNPPEIITPADHLRLYKTIFENRGEFIWFPKQRGKGGQPMRLLNGAVLSLYEVCLFHIRQRLQSMFNPPEQLNPKYTQLCFRAIDGIVAAIAYALFPDAFKISPDPKRILRTVRRTYRKSEQYIIDTKATIKAEYFP